MELGELPEGWSKATVGEVATLFRGVTYSKDQASNTPQIGMKPILRGNNINGELNFDDLVYVPEALIAPEQLISAGDIIFAMSSGSKHLVGKSAKARISFDGGFGAFCGLLRATEAINKDFLHYVFQGSDFRRAISEVSKGSNINNLKREHILDFEFSCPPLAEQHRIVAKVEELFSELDQGVASLKAAREQLKVYRQSLLKNAFEGKLTAAWRAAHADLLETATALQQRIARERQARYQQQLADWQTAGQPGPKPKPPKPLPPLTPEELAELPELPAGWEWVKLEALISGVDQGWSPKCEGRRVDENEWAVIKTTAIQHGRFDELENKVLPPGLEPRTQHELKPGDILVTRAGPRVRVGVCCLVRSVKPKLMNCDKAYRIRALPSLSSPEFLEAVLNSPRVLDVLERIKSGINDSGVNLNQGAFLELAIPFCGLSEQQAVVQELESKLSEADQLDQTLATALQQSDALRQSILKKAFHGQLVKQDKNDEPATALLERIRAAKSGQSKGKPRRIAPDQPEILELTASPGQVIPFPVPLPGIAAKDLQAGIVAMAYRLHEPHPEKLQHFGHVKAEKICHLVEAHLGLDLERQPVKEAAGPNDHPHLKKVEHRARMVNWFDVSRLDSGKYVFHPKSGFDRLLAKTRLALGPRLDEVERLLELMLPMTMRQAEILATVYAAWNNLLLLGKSPNDEEIVTEARENWHESKLKIEREKFFRALEWMREKGLVPVGQGRFVAERPIRGNTG